MGAADSKGGRPQTLSRRALNRATLARQLLLDRSGLSVPEAVEHLVGLQAQTPHSWYVGLWTRLRNLRPEHVADLITNRELVRIALMRSTIHLVTARDCLALRPLVQPVLVRSMNGNFGRHLTGVDIESLIAVGRQLVEEKPRTFSELGRLLAEQWPDRDPGALAQVFRAFVPLVQVPPRGIWGSSGRAAHASAEAWLGASVRHDLTAEDLIVRYLAAFGPATVGDMQTWSGLTGLRTVVERLGARLLTFNDERGRELYDLPEAPRPDPDTPAPPRFLYDFDNLLLSHADRSRAISDAHQQQGFSAEGALPSLLLVDGFTSGRWTIDRNRGRATLTIRPFIRLPGAAVDELTAEGALLLGFVAADAEHDIQFVSA